MVARVGMEDFRYVGFEHCRPWFIHSYKKIDAPLIEDIIDGNRMDQLLRAPINGGRAWPEPCGAPSLPPKRKATEDNQEPAAKRAKLGNSYCTFAEKTSATTHPDEELLCQPGVFDTAFGHPNEDELISDTRERQRMEEEEKKKKNEQARQERREEKERLQKEAVEKKAVEAQERAAKRKKKLKEKEKKKQEKEMERLEKEQEKKKKIVERKKKKMEGKKEIADDDDDDDTGDEGDDDNIEIIIASENPQAPPGGSELKALATMGSMGKKEQSKPTKGTSLKKKASKVPRTASQCPEAITLNSLAHIVKQDEAKQKKATKATTSTRTRSTSQSSSPLKPPKLVSIIKPSSLPQVDGPQDEASSNFLGSFKRVRLLCRPWRVPSGSINRPAFKLMLEAVCMQAMQKPGITMPDLLKCFQPSLHMTPVLELVETLQSIGCFKLIYISSRPKPTLFSKRNTFVEVEEADSLTSAIVIPTADCILKLGQFVNDLLNVGKQ